MSAPDGGPAFPGRVPNGRHPDHQPPTLHGGMSLRDWFAGQVLAGMTAAPDGPPIGGWDWDWVAEECYKVADAMIQHRRSS